MYSYKPQDGAWSLAVAIPNSERSFGSPAVAIDSHNNIHVVWYAWMGSDPDKFWYVRNSAGTWSKPKELAVGNVDDTESLVLTLAGDDNLFLMWKHESNLLPYRYITKMDGSNWSETTEIPLTNEDDNYSLTGNRVYALLGDRSGGIHVTWYTERGTSHFNHASALIEEVALPPMSAQEIAVLPGVVEFPISTGPGEREDPDMDGDIIVWSQNSGQGWDILGYDLSTETEFPIIAREDSQVSPAISGDLVVWQDHREDFNTRIYGYNLNTKTEFPVTARSSPQWHPDISGDLVVFTDWRKNGT
jgi:beta propeller repeat protein